jgi:hypothetical protein
LTTPIVRTVTENTVVVRIQVNEGMGGRGSVEGGRWKEVES